MQVIEEVIYTYTNPDGALHGRGPDHSVAFARQPGESSQTFEARIEAQTKSMAENGYTQAVQSWKRKKWVTADGSFHSAIMAPKNCSVDGAYAWECEIPGSASAKGQASSFEEAIAIGRDTLPKLRDWVRTALGR